MSDQTAEQLARMFHETYERLAPQFGYQTNMTTRLFNPESPNGRFMMATCAEVARSISATEIERLRAENAELRKQLTVTDDRDRTHSDECWKWHRHHGCAIGRVEQLEARLPTLTEEPSR